MNQPNARTALLEILSETRVWLARPSNDFGYSTWSSTAEALREFDAAVSSLNGGQGADLSELTVLFAPTGSLQEVSMDSGWSDEFLDLARRFDTALARDRESRA
jgi:hypothetical protein